MSLDHVGQAVGADEQLIARLESHEMHVGPRVVRFVAQAAGEHVAELAGDFRRDAGGDEFLLDRVVDRHAPHRAVAPQEAWRIADLRDDRERAHEIGGRERRAALAELRIDLVLVDERLLHHVHKAFDPLRQLGRVQVSSFMTQLIVRPARSQAVRIAISLASEPQPCPPMPSATAIAYVSSVGKRKLLGRHVGEQQLLRARAPQHEVVILVLAATQAHMARGAEFVRQVVGHRMNEILGRGERRLHVFDRFGIMSAMANASQQIRIAEQDP